MPRAQRSRACQQCRERRVKCDETPQVCQQCNRLGLRCSGPIQGSVIIDMTDRVMKPRPRKKREPKTSPGAGAGSAGTAVAADDEASEVVVKREPDVADEHEPSAMTALPLSSAMPASRHPAVAKVEPNESEAQDAVARIQHQYRLPAYHQPSRAVPDALDIAFISHFVKQNNNSRKYTPEVPWITQLPNLHGATTNPAVRLSIRAASMAFYAVVHRDTTVLVDSYRWYIVSLNCQRRSLARLPNGKIPNTEEILVPIILSIYETYAGTTTTSIWPHLAAAAKFLELRGPDNCNGVASTLFKIMRVSDAHKAIVFNKPSAFASPDWMEAPFRKEGKSAHQELCDILLLIPGTIALLGARHGSLRQFFARSLPSNVTNVDIVVERITQWLLHLEGWAVRFPYLTKAPIENLVVTKDMANLGEGFNTTPNPEKALPNTFVAFTAASYEAVRLILLLLLHKVTPFLSQTPPHTPSTTHSTVSVPSESALLDTAATVSQSILDICHYQDSTHPIGGFDVLRSVFPVVLVGLLGPRQEEKDIAYETLVQWGEKRGITGLCTAWFTV